MTVSHPDPGEVDRFLRGELSGGTNRQLVRSLLAAWRICRDELGQIWEHNHRLPSVLRARVAAGRLPANSDYSRSFEGLLPILRARAEEVSRERRLLPGLIAHLRTLSVSELRDLLVGEGELRSWLFCEWLIEELRPFLYIDPPRARELAELAVTIAESLDPEAYGVPLIRDLQARAWSHAGEALRVLSDLRSAERASARAEDLVAQGTGDALEEAQVHELKAALRQDQHRPAEAHGLLDAVIRVYRQYRDSHLVGRAFIQKGEVYGSCEELEPAILWLRKGLELVDPTRERHLDLSVRQSLMLYLHESGRHREARFLLKASRSEFQQHGGELLNLRLLWLEGKIHGSLGFVEKAEECLAEARQGFIRLGIGFSAAAVSLDLAALYAGQGRSAEIRRLSAEMLLIFQSRDLHQQAVAALIAFQRAVALEGVSSKLLVDLRSYLERARKDPQLRFEPA
jgi:tetratricopeptide (TPR) repeat protein